MNDPKMVRMTAAMEGESVIVRNIGRRRTVSEMELIVLCNFARLELLSEFAKLGGEVGTRAAANYDVIIKLIQETFSGGSKSDGLERLATSCAAILNQPRFKSYIV